MIRRIVCLIIYELLNVDVLSEGRTSSKAYSIDVVRNRFGATEVRNSQQKKSNKFADIEDGFETASNTKGEEYHWYCLYFYLFLKFYKNNFNSLFLYFFIQESNISFNWISKNRQIVARVLFIYAKLNPGQGYVQGMNEIIGPIYYVFANDNSNGWSGTSCVHFYHH